MILFFILNLVFILKVNCLSELKNSEKINNASFSNSNKSLAQWEDTFLNFDQIVLSRGYPFEAHEVTTEDGYILTIFRIPNGLNDSTIQKKPVVFLQHGLFGSSVDWIIQGPDKALAYMLADNGYDVWLGNARGSFYSRKHEFLNPDIDTITYWDFTWNEIGFYDIPAVIDYILLQTGQEKLFHVGHSQGTTTFYVMNSQKPEYNNKIRAHFSLSPVVFCKNLISPFWRTGATFDTNLLLESIKLTTRKYEILPRSKSLPVLCTANQIISQICETVFFTIAPFSSNQMNRTLLSILYGHSPAGASIKQLFHYFQLVQSGSFRQWDYGITGNLIHYLSASPPDYNLSEVTAPVYLFNSKNDWLSAESDVEKLQLSLPNVRDKFLNPDAEWNHDDFIYGTDADQYIYIPIINILTEICANELC